MKQSMGHDAQIKFSKNFCKHGFRHSSFKIESAHIVELCQLGVKLSLDD